MKTYRFSVDIYVYADSEAEAAESIISEMDYLCGWDNQIQAYSHPGAAVEINPDTVEQ